MDGRPIASGHYFRIHVNQGWREARVLVVLEELALIEYTMPKGTTGLRIIPLSSFEENRNEVLYFYGGISYKSVPRRWLEALVREGVEWDGIPQKSKKWALSPKEMIHNASQE